MAAPMRTQACLISLALGLGGLALAKDCGPLPQGQNPATEDLEREIARVSAAHGVPTEIIKAVAWQESGCQQWRADGSFVHNPKDCGLGMMQLTGATAGQFDLERLKRDWRYNLDAGVTVLRDKWQRAVREGVTPADPAAREVLENWYYAVAYYWGGRSEEYLRKIFGHLAARPGRLQQLLRRSVTVSLPSDVIPGFSFGHKFQALLEGKLVDAQGRAHRAQVHRGTIGDAEALAGLDLALARGERAAARGDAREAVRWLLRAIQADLDTAHRSRAEALLAPLLEQAQATLNRAVELRRAGDKEGERLLRRLLRDWKGHPFAERVQAALGQPEG